MNGMEGRALPLGRGARPELKALIREASVALARLDAARLEELAASCEALTTAGVEACEARDAVAEMTVLGRVLEATRANAEVMQRLCSMRAGRIEYIEQQARGCSAEIMYGHD
jgi:hypothetical protein